MLLLQLASQRLPCNHNTVTCKKMKAIMIGSPTAVLSLCHRPTRWAFGYQVYLVFVNRLSVKRLRLLRLAKEYFSSSSVASVEAAVVESAEANLLSRLMQVGTISDCSTRRISFFADSNKMFFITSMDVSIWESPSLVSFPCCSMASFTSDPLVSMASVILTWVSSATFVV